MYQLRPGGQFYNAANHSACCALIANDEFGKQQHSWGNYFCQIVFPFFLFLEGENAF
jgi:hypothetical protein